MNINTINTAVKEAVPIEVSKPSVPSTQPEPDETIQNGQALAKTREDNNRTLSLSDAKELTEDMNELMDDLQTSLGFSIREDLNHQVVVVISNRETNELIKQIPSEELLTIKEKMEEITGLLFDQSV